MKRAAAVSALTVLDQVALRRPCWRRLAWWRSSTATRGAHCNRRTIVVDEDIDPTNINDAIWAMRTLAIRACRSISIHGAY